MVSGTLLNFGKRYKDKLRVICDQWLKLHLGLDALSNQKILKGIYNIHSAHGGILLIRANKISVETSVC